MVVNCDFNYSYNCEITPIITMFGLASCWRRLPIIVTYMAGQSRILQRYSCWVGLPTTQSQNTGTNLLKMHHLECTPECSRVLVHTRKNCVTAELRTQLCENRRFITDIVYKHLCKVKVRRRLKSEYSIHIYGLEMCGILNFSCTVVNSEKFWCICYLFVESK